MLRQKLAHQWRSSQKIYLMMIPVRIWAILFWQLRCPVATCISDFCLDAIASPSSYPCQWVSESVSQSLKVSDFGDSYCIYRACLLCHHLSWDEGWKCEENNDNNSLLVDLKVKKLLGWGWGWGWLTTYIWWLTTFKSSRDNLQLLYHPYNLSIHPYNLSINPYNF